ncbi:MAG: beta-galactosidase trimerization domain-containing protein [Spirochaetaceae bacterium]|jgi:hypothetical protein|nr:beta-galactosidase trimerization domain-containing protein [Spirochaetaceae bacterium]
MEKWYEKVRRYGQTNLTEIDPQVCDLNFWRDYWKKTDTQGIIVNAGGIVAYYPSKFKNHYRAAKLGNRDLFGEFVKAGREMGLAILARMDINRAVKAFYDERPDWFTRKKDGSPYVTQGRYLSCVSSGYYTEFVPDVLKEIIELYHPDGFTDNSWTGISKTSICYCENCKKSFGEYSGGDLPEQADYSDPVYRKWITWSHSRRIKNWDLFNKITKEYGGEDCLWMGMINANFANRSGFCDLAEVGKRSKLIMLDQQSRDGNGFEQNSLNGLLLHQLSGWDAIIAESMATYTRGNQAYRRGAATLLETKLWMLEGIAGGISPWWHIIGGAQEDKRIFNRPLAIFDWHKKYEKYFYNRKPVANVGVLWSQRNAEFFGAQYSAERAERSFRGVIMALTRKGIPFVPINAADIAGQSKGMDLLILPELAVLNDKDKKAIEDYARKGGNVFAIGAAGVMNEDGSVRANSALEGLLGVRFDRVNINDDRQESNWEIPVMHTYLRMARENHAIFKSFEETVVLPMGGIRKNVTALKGADVLATLIPAFPMYPPEFVWTDTPETELPVITEHSLQGGGKAIYAAWNLDSLYGKSAHPDHGDLLGNIVTYLLGNRIPVQIESEAYLDFKVYRQEKRIIIHLVNGNNTGFSQGYAEKTIPVGPVKISVNLPGDFTSATATEDGAEVKLSRHSGGITLELARLGLHQLIILE